VAKLQVSKLRRVGNVTLPDGLITVGRSSENDVVLPSNSVSRRHCTIEESDGAPVLRDLGSSGGTRVNGLRVDRVRLYDGDLIGVGSFELAFTAPDHPRPASIGTAETVRGSSKKQSGDHRDDADHDAIARERAAVIAERASVEAARKALDAERDVNQRDREAIEAERLTIEDERRSLEDARREADRVAADDLDRLRAEQANSKAGAEALRSERDATIASLQADLEDLTRRADASSQEQQEDPEEPAAVSAERLAVLAALTLERDEARRALDAIRAGQDSERTQLAAATAERDELRAELEVAITERDELLEAPSDAIDIEALQAECRSAVDTRDSLQKQLETRMSQLEAAEAERDALARERERDAAGAVSTESSAAIEQERDCLRVEREAAREQIASLQSEYDVATQSLKESRETNEASEAERDAMIAAAVKSQEDQAHQAMSALEKQADSLQQQVDRLMTDLSRRDTRIAELEAETRSLENLRTQLVHRLASVGTTANSARDELIGLDNAVVPLRDLNAQLLDVRESIDIFEGQWVAADERVQAAQDAGDDDALKKALTERDAVARRLDGAHSSTDSIIESLARAVATVDEARVAVRKRLAEAEEDDLVSPPHRSPWVWVFVTALVALAVIIGFFIGKTF
jgi:pSer/pThr/pTyr-binding forkhead associated (FHA) protein